MISIKLVERLPEHNEWREEFIDLWGKMNDEKRSIYLSLERAEGVPSELEKFYLEFVDEGRIIEFPDVKPNKDWAFRNFTEDLKACGFKYEVFDLIVESIDKEKLSEAYPKFFCSVYNKLLHRRYESIHYDPVDNRFIAIKEY